MGGGTGGGGVGGGGAKGGPIQKIHVTYNTFFSHPPDTGIIKLRQVRTSVLASVIFCPFLHTLASALFVYARAQGRKQ